MKFTLKRKMLVSFSVVLIIPPVLTVFLLFINIYNHISNHNINDLNNFQSSNYTFNNCLIIVFGFITMIILIILSIYIISKSVLTPLKELNIATKHIADGNLDYRITYNKNDELGLFCKTFDSMRVKLKESLEKQARDEKSRKEMIASVSHDLRTPLSSIKGYVEGLQDGIVSDKKDVNNYLSIIKNKTDTLDKLIDDLFDFSKLELNKLEMNYIVDDSNNILSDMFSNIKLEFQNNNVKLDIEKPYPSVQIKIDPYRLNQVFDNLINNALIYSDKDLLIKVGAIIKDSDLVFYVKDNGIGIEQKDLPYIFERFYRSEKSRSRQYGGTGLGLSICKNIINIHGGEIWVDSIIHEGSCFYFSIPITNKCV
ncbi:hypothetical protein SH1V18_22980 [Vallitalea longa]|uniref:histidine kinase n=1 Tax=Vallitalea longa TaxID=2936439 RepID=A0A9W5YEN2_9FIRM|nr:HAMP domain-containing sensor histidine kinase [Vallitalea longa]GKX29818.1 hypothetical protein SH1V18_22980 [Vallitalea longa]